jgi:hypothetical protein
MAGKKSIKFDKRHYDLARRLSANGLSRVMIAKALGVNEVTLYRRMDKDARLKEALTLGDSEDIQTCVSVLRERALNGSAQHMDRYLQLRHGLYIGGARPAGFERRANQMIVVIPFETGNEEWSKLAGSERARVIEGELTLENDTNVIQHTLTEENN